MFDELKKLPCVAAFTAAYEFGLRCDNLMQYFFAVASVRKYVKGYWS